MCTNWHNDNCEWARLDKGQKNDVTYLTFEILFPHEQCQEKMNYAAQIGSFVTGACSGLISVAGCKKI